MHTHTYTHTHPYIYIYIESMCSPIQFANSIEQCHTTIPIPFHDSKIVRPIQITFTLIIEKSN